MLLILLSVIIFISGSVSIAVGGIGAEDLYGYACALHENECFLSAMVYFTKIKNDFSGTKLARESEYMAGECLQGEKKYWKAIEQWKSVIKKYPGTDTAGKAEEDIKSVKKIIERNTLEGMERYPVTLDEMMADVFVCNGYDGEVRIYINNRVIEAEFEAGVSWYDRAMAEYPDAPASLVALDKKGWCFCLRNSPKDFKKGIDEYLTVMDKFSGDDQWVLRMLGWCGDIAKDDIGDTRYAAELYMKLIDESKKRIGEVSYHGQYAKTKLRIMGKKVE